MKDRLALFIASSAVLFILTGCNGNVSGTSNSHQTSTNANVAASNSSIASNGTKEKSVKSTTYYVLGVVGSVIHTKNVLKVVEIGATQVSYKSSSPVPFHTYGNSYTFVVKMNATYGKGTMIPQEGEKIIAKLRYVPRSTPANSYYTGSMKDLFIYRKGAYQNNKGIKLQPNTIQWKSITTKPDQ